MGKRKEASGPPDPPDPPPKAAALTAAPEPKLDVYQAAIKAGLSEVAARAAGAATNVEVLLNALKEGGMKSRAATDVAKLYGGVRALGS